MSEFCLEAFIATNKQSSHRSAITPKKFNIGDHVRQLDPSTKKPSPNTFSVIGYDWYGNRWFYEILPGVYTNGDYLIKSNE